MRSLAAFFVCFAVIFSVSSMSGAMFSGHQFNEDYELFEIQNELVSGEGIGETIARYTAHDHMRIRIYYFFRVLQVALFGAQVHVFRLILAILGSVAIFGFYRFARSLDLSWRESLVFSFLVFLGPQAMIWWRMGTAENLGMFFLSLALISISTVPRSVFRVRLRDAAFVVCVALSSLSKESFIVAVPALLFLKVWHTRRLQSLTWKDALIQNGVPAGLLLLLVTGQIMFIVFVTGSVVAGYAGFEGIQWASFFKVLGGLLGVHSWAIGGLLTILVTRWAISRGRFFLKSLKEIVLALAFFMLMSVPTALLFQKTGLNQTYVLPNVFASVLLLGILYRTIRENERRVIRFVAVFFVLATLAGAFHGAWDGGRAFAGEGKIQRELVRLIGETTSKSEPIVFALDPARNMEWGWAMRIYLKEIADRENVYLLPLFRQNYSEFDKYLIKDHPDNILKRFAGRMLGNVRDPSKIQTVVIFPFSGLWFWLRPPSWFDRSAFTSKTIGRYVVLRRI